MISMILSVGVAVQQAACGLLVDALAVLALQLARAQLQLGRQQLWMKRPWPPAHQQHAVVTGVGQSRAG